MWVKKNKNINHHPVITINICGMVCLPFPVMGGLWHYFTHVITIFGGNNHPLTSQSVILLIFNGISKIIIVDISGYYWMVKKKESNIQKNIVSPIIAIFNTPSSHSSKHPQHWSPQWECHRPSGRQRRRWRCPTGCEGWPKEPDTRAAWDVAA